MVLFDNTESLEEHREQAGYERDDNGDLILAPPTVLRLRLRGALHHENHSVHRRTQEPDNVQVSEYT